MARYCLQNRYQDSGWEPLSIEGDNPDELADIAAEKSKDAIIYGMVRLVDVVENKVLLTFSAGCGLVPSECDPSFLQRYRDRR